MSSQRGREVGMEGGGAHVLRVGTGRGECPVGGGGGDVLKDGSAIKNAVASYTALRHVLHRLPARSIDPAHNQLNSGGTT